MICCRPLMQLSHSPYSLLSEVLALKYVNLCRARGELLYELEEYEDALVDLQAANRLMRNHEHTLRYGHSFTNT